MLAGCVTANVDPGAVPVQHAPPGSGDLAGLAEPSIPPLPAGRVLDEPVTLVPGVKAGLVFVFEKRQADRTTFDSKGPFGTTTTDMVSLTSFKGKCAVLEAEGGIPTKARVTCDPDCQKGTTIFGDLDKVHAISSYAGKVLTVSVNRLGTVIVDAPAVDANDQTDLEEEAQALLEHPSYMPPDPKPLKAGDEWDGVAPHVTSHCRLVAVREIDGRKVAEVQIRELRFHRERTGPVFVDTETGLVLSSRLDYEGTEHGDVGDKPVHAIMLRRERARLASQ